MSSFNYFYTKFSDKDNIFDFLNEHYEDYLNAENAIEEDDEIFEDMIQKAESWNPIINLDK